MRKHPFIIDHIYHIYNRGVEKRKVFLDNPDYFRFVHNLLELNTSRPAVPINLAARQTNLKQLTWEIQPPGRPLRVNPLVEILAFCLMPNHYHLLVRQVIKNGIIGFMQKLGTGYTMYFNQKYRRVGPLFQGRFKSILVERNEHLIYLPYYVHANPLELRNPEWKNGKLKNLVAAIEFLRNYHWSSHRDYLEIINFPAVTSRKFLGRLFGGASQYQKDFNIWLKERNLESVKDLVLEKD